MSEFDQMSNKEKALSALKSLTLERYDLEKEEEAQIYNVQLKFQKKYQILFEKQNKIIQGADVAEGDCDKYLSLNIHDSKENEDRTDICYDKENGFKNFWLTVLKNSKHTKGMILSVDEPVLEYLTLIQVKQIDPDNPFPEYPEYKSYGIILEFHFSTNPYFTNNVLYKYFKIEPSVHPQDPFEYEGYTPVSIDFSPINWKPEKNITVKEVKKTQKNKKTKQVRVVTKIEKVPSFFNFFTKIEGSEVEDKMSKEELELVIQSIMFSEYDLVQHIQTELLPKAVLYYLGEIGDDEEEEECESECDSEDYENDDDDDIPVKKSPNRRKTDGFLAASPQHK